jgi:hypothetical protein
MSELMTGGAGERRLSAAEFQQLARVPVAAEWFANLDNRRTHRAYQNDLADFCGFVGLSVAEEFRAVPRAHVLAWRAQLETRASDFGGAAVPRITPGRGRVADDRRPPGASRHQAPASEREGRQDPLFTAAPGGRRTYSCLPVTARV